MGRSIVLVAIGDEVLYGITQNTDASCLAAAFVERGLFPLRHIVVSDKAEEIASALLRELREGNDVITTGGLGPTIDDVTKSVVADIFSQPLERREELFAELAARYGADFPTIENQSLQPKNAVLLHNTVGTAPGLFLEDQHLFPHSRLFVLPGPPHEMRDVFFREVLPQYFEKASVASKVFRLIGINEYEIDLILRRLQQQFPQLHIGIYPSYETVTVCLAAQGDPCVLERVEESLRAAFPENRFLRRGPSLEKELLEIFRERQWTMATAESCTAGGVGARIASVPGASDVFLGGIIAYQDSIKEQLLGVPKQFLLEHGAVSIDVTDVMAINVRAQFGSDVSCAVSGYFGPSGGTKNTPVGTVCVSIVLPGDRIVRQQFLFHGSRESICERTIQTVLKECVFCST